MKQIIATTYKVPIVAGQRATRTPDTTPPTTPALGGTSDFPTSPPVPDVSQVTLNWVNGQDPDSGILDTQVEYSPSTLGQWTVFGLIPYNAGQGVSAVVTGLSPNSAYDFRIKNHNYAGLSSSYSKIVTVTTVPTSQQLAPGTVTLGVTSLNVQEGQPISVAVTLSGAGSASPGCTVTWQFSNFNQGMPSPGNGFLTFPAGSNGTQFIQSTAGQVLTNSSGLLSIVSVTALSGNINPSTGNTQATVNIQVPSTTGVKWNPGHYGASNNITFPNDRHLTNQIQEQNTVINSGVNVLGIEMFYTMGCFGNAPYDFSKIFRDLNKMRAAGKRLHIQLMPQIFGSGNDYADLLPSEVYNNNTYSASPTAGKFGWWSANGGLETVIAFWNQKEMDWCIGVFQALAAAVNPATGLTVDQDPFVEQISFGETSIAIDPGSTYNGNGIVTQYERLISACQVAFPNTLFMCNINFTDNQAQTQTLTTYAANNRAIMGSPDTIPGHLGWGQAAMIGAAQSQIVWPGFTPNASFTGPDLRGVMGSSSDTQAPDITAAKYGPPTPMTVFQWCDQVLHQSHMKWVILDIGATNPPVPAYPGTGTNTGVNPGNWNSVLQVINGNPLTHIQKPSGIP